MALRICLAGRVRVEADEGSVEPGLGRLGALALTYLACERDRYVTQDELAEVLWGEALPDTWRTSLRGIVSRLRAALRGAGLAGQTVIVSGDGSYRFLLPEGAVIDVEEATRAVEQAEVHLGAGRAVEAAGAAARAVEVAGGGFAVGTRGLWAEQRQAELSALHVRALEVLAGAETALGRHQAAVGAATEAVAVEPLRESAHRRLVRAHAAAGNRAEALRAYERLRRALAEELGVSPSAATESLYLTLVEEPEPAPPAGGVTAAPASPRSRLPMTSFVGRAERVGEVTRLLGGARLVTLTGPGGVGKSRLALEAATDLAGSLPGGVHLAELAAVADAELLTRHVLAAVGGKEEPGHDPAETLAGRLGGQAAVLLLDNCEHLVEACAGLAEMLLRACPDLRVLATSREPLGVPGETRWAVPPLGTPEPGPSTLDGVAGTEAGRLFLDRARAVRPDLQLGHADAAAVAQICRRLDGLPLALELAAGRANVLSLAEIASRLDDRLNLLAAGPRLAPARHRSLRAALDWGYESLPDQQRELFTGLSVFRTGFDIDGAEQVGTAGGLDGGMVLGVLADLVNRSLVTVERRGEGTRYRLLETVRQYASERLAEWPDHEHAALARHLDWATGLAEQAGAHLTGPEQAHWLQQLDEAHDDLQAALQWALSEDDASVWRAALRLAAALGRYWEVRGHLGQGRHWLELALERATDAQPLVRARALTAAAILAQGQGDYQEARALYQEALVICRAAGDRGAAAAVLHGLGNLAARQGELAEARRLYEETLAAARELGDVVAEAASLTNIGAVAHDQGDLGAARRSFEQSLVLLRQRGDRDATALVVGNLGYLAFQEGEHAEARSLFEESLAARRELGDAQGTASVLCNLGYLALAEGRLEEARTTLEEALALAREVGDRHWTMLSLLRLARVFRAHGDHRRGSALLREAVALATGLGAKRAIAEWLEGVASTAVHDNALERAVRLLGAADGLRQAIGAPLPRRDVATHDEELALARAKLGDGSFDAAWAAGQAMTLEEAMAHAMADGP